MVCKHFTAITAKKDVYSVLYHHYSGEEVIKDLCVCVCVCVCVRACVSIWQDSLRDDRKWDEIEGDDMWWMATGQTAALGCCRECRACVNGLHALPTKLPGCPYMISGCVMLLYESFPKDLKGGETATCVSSHRKVRSQSGHTVQRH